MKPKMIVLSALMLTCCAQLSSAEEQVSNFPSNYNNISISYRNVNFGMSGPDFNMNGGGFDYIHGFSVSKTLPIYVETGAGITMVLKDTGSGSYGAYGYIDVPVNAAYRFQLATPGLSVSPYLGLVLKGNIVGTSDIASDSQEWYSDGDFKRFQLGWHLGCTLDYKKLHVGIGYGTDFIQIAKKVNSGTFNLSVGLNI